MPAPSKFLTIVDADGDEFPIRIWEGTFETVVQERQHALKELERLIAEGKANPTFPVIVWDGKTETS